MGLRMPAESISADRREPCESSLPIGVMVGVEGGRVIASAEGEAEMSGSIEGVREGDSVGDRIGGDSDG